MLSQKRTISSPLIINCESNSQHNYKNNNGNVYNTINYGTKKYHNIKNQYLRNPNTIHTNYSTFSNSTNTIIAPLVGFSTAKTITIINSYNTQVNNYVNTISSQQAIHLQQTNTYLSNVNVSNGVRNYGNWDSVKRLVIRDELMKIQIGGKTSLPISKTQYLDLSKKLNGLDLSNMNDSKVNSIISDVLHTNEQHVLDSLKAFKSSGVIDDCFQTQKLSQLQDYLKNVDLNKITYKEYKYIENNFIEKIEIHHRTSISADPTLQSDINNLDTLNTTQHNAKHTNPETGKIDYRNRLNEKPLDRIKELEDINTKRIFAKELSGIAVSAAIGLGVGFAIGFITSLAENGVNPNTIKYALVSGSKQGKTTALMSAGSTIIGRTIGDVASNALTKFIISSIGKNLAEETIQNISYMCKTGVVGSITIIAFSIYQFGKLKQNGYSTKECLLRTGKSSALSFSVLIISIISAGLWGQSVGIAVSVVAGIIIIGYNVLKTSHNRVLQKEITYYSIRLCKPQLEYAQ